MKRKIIALLMATVCSTAILVSCDGKKSACGTHADANNDGLCDGCEKAVVHIVEHLPAEEEKEVPMVVNAIPTDVKMSEFINSTVEKDVIKANSSVKTVDDILAIPEGAALVGSVDSRFYNNYQYLLLKYTTIITTLGEEETPVKTVSENFVKLYDVEKDKVVLSFNSGEAINNWVVEDTVGGWVVDEDKNGATQDVLNISFETGYIRVQKNVKSRVLNEDNEYEISIQRTTSVYTYNWDLIAEKTEEPDEEVSIQISCDEKRDYYYITVDGTTYSVDKASNELVDLEGATNVAELHLQRPNFTKVVGDKGYIFESDKIWIYDLTKWVSCLQVINYPSYWFGAEPYVLADGNVLVQYAKMLPNDTINYDFMEGSIKLDVCQVIINPVTGEQKEVEFGYIIDSQIEDATMFTDKATNVFVINPIEEKNVSNEEIIVAVDNELNIQFAYLPTVTGQDLDETELIANGVFGTIINYGGGVTQTILINADGEKLVVVPTNASFKFGLAKIGSKFYKLDMETLVLDIADYNVIANKASYMILSKTEDNPEYDAETNPTVPETITTYYFFNGGELVTLTGSNFVSFNDKYFVEKTQDTTDPENIVDVYKVYNINNELVAEFDKAISSIQELFDGVYGITFQNGDFVCIR